MYQKVILLLYIMFITFIIYTSFTKLEHLSNYTRSQDMHYHLDKYDDYLFDYRSKKIITIFLKNVNMINLDKLSLKEKLSEAMKISDRRIHILNIDENMFKISLVIENAYSSNETSIPDAILLLKESITNKNSDLLKYFNIILVKTKNLYVNDNKYYKRWWDDIDIKSYI